MKTQTQDYYNIGPHAYIIITEVHAIGEAVQWIWKEPTLPRNIYICVNNQIAPRALAGGQWHMKKDLTECRKGIPALCVVSL